MILHSFDAVFHHVLWSVSYVLVLIGLSAYGIHRYSIIYLFLKHRNAEPVPRMHFEHLPVVTVQLPIFNEYYVVRRLLKAVGEIDYPRDRLQIQVLDDSTDDTTSVAAEEVERLRAKGIDITLIHRVNREGFKAGALAEGMQQVRGEFVFILDADFVPPRDILQKCIHHFTDPKIGMVQVRWGHINRDQSLLTRLQAMFLDGHLLLEQTARDRSGRFFNFNGTAGIWRRSCIEQAGGWHHDTLTEDLDLSYRAQLRGWKFLFLPHLIIPAELPSDINGFKSQQHRWTKGSIQTCLKLLPTIWRKKLPLIIKLEATIHLTSNFGYLLLLLLCILILPQSYAPHGGWLQTFLVDIPIFLATTVSIATFYMVAQWHLNPRGWIRDMLLLPMLLALAIGMSVNNARGVLEALLNRKSEFQRTPKYGSGEHSSRSGATRYFPALRSFLPIIEVLFAIYFSYCTWHAASSGAWTSVPFLLLFLVGFVYVSTKSAPLFGRSLARFISPPRRTIPST